MIAGNADYKMTTASVVLETIIHSICQNVHIMDDTVPETEEEFFVCLYSISPQIEVPTNCTVVHIIDNESKWT